MKGYNSLNQFIEDYKMYTAAKKVDPGKEGETITSYFKRKIDKKLSMASKQFKATLKNRNYSRNDLKIIAIHDYARHIPSLEFFIREYFGLNYVSPEHYRKILSSNAFKAGRLKRLYEFIPIRIETKTEFVRFIKSKRDIPKAELSAVMNHICNKNWRQWLNEIIDTGKIQEQGGRWIT